MTWTCTNGCLTDGRPTKHANEAACPVVREQRKAAKVQRAQQAVAPPRTPAPASEEPAVARPPERTAEPRAVEWVRESASTVAAPAIPTAQESYLLEGQDVVDFWQIILSIGEMVINLLLAFLEVKKLPDDVCDLKKSKATSLLISRNMRHTTSQFFISLGVKTKGEAQALIGEGQGVIAFGGIFIGIAWHLGTEIPKSPVLARWKKEGLLGPAQPGAAAPTGPNATRPWWDPFGMFPTANPGVVTDLPRVQVPAA